MIDYLWILIKKYGGVLIAVTTSEASGLSVRVGDVKKLRFRNVYNYGFSIDASITSPALNTEVFGINKIIN